jgi:transposase-like protein
MGVSRPRRSFDREFKVEIVRQVRSGEKRLSQVCREYQLSETLVRRWKEQYEQHGEDAWPAPGALTREAHAEQRVRELEGALGRLHLENELLRRALKQAEKGGSLPGRSGK